VRQTIEFLKAYFYSENSTLKDFDGFVAFHTAFRQEFVALKVTDRKPVIFKCDPTGK
jgi:hypothetical protein